MPRTTRSAIASQPLLWSSPEIGAPFGTARSATAKIPKTPPSVVALLASGSCEGWQVNHLRFDARDAINRLERVDAEYFPWRSDAEWRRALGDPAIARAHLDAVHSYLADCKPADRPSGAVAHLPDGQGQLHPLSTLKKGAAIPTELLELDVPPVIDPTLRSHAVFKLEGWKLDSFVLRDLLRDGGLETKSAAVLRRLFGWIAANPDELGRDEWPAVRALPIWPATDASLHPFDGLCLPDAKVAAALGNAIAKPAREVRALADKARKGKSKLSLRTEPIAEEIRAFYKTGTNPFWLGAPLNDDQRRDFHAFETVLAMLGRNKPLVPLLRALRALRDDVIAVARDGVVRPAASLVAETAEVRLLALEPNYLIDRPEQGLDAIMPPARRPSGRISRGK